MATLGLSKVFILDKYFTELQKFWETEKKLQDASSSNEAVHLHQRLKSLSSELVTLRNRLHVGQEQYDKAESVAVSKGSSNNFHASSSNICDKIVNQAQIGNIAKTSVTQSSNIINPLNADKNLPNSDQMALCAEGSKIFTNQESCKKMNDMKGLRNISIPHPLPHQISNVIGNQMFQDSSTLLLANICSEEYQINPLTQHSNYKQNNICYKVNIPHLANGQKSNKRNNISGRIVLNRNLSDQLDDLIHLSGPLTEHAVMRTIQSRFNENRYFTNVGPILLSVNSYLDIGNPLTLSSTRSLPLAPQLEKMIQETVRQQAETGYPQAIILSGASGSGKTHCSMLLLRQLFAVAGGGPETDAFKHLAAAFTVLRSLGSAKTTQNSESSRIGQFIEVQVTDGALYRTKIHCYFLDQSRVIKSLPKEKNYHIFYQMLAGLSHEERLKLNLEGYSLTNLKYLHNGDTLQNELEDSKRFQSWKTCLSILGIPFLDVVRVLAAVLLLGNIQFTDGQALEVNVKGETELNSVASLLGVPPAALFRGLTTRTHNARGQLIKSICDANMSNMTRDCLAKALYCRTVATIVRRANSLKRIGSTLGTLSSDSNESVHNQGDVTSQHASLAGGNSGSKSMAALNNAVRHATDGFIGILDMFGFEEPSPYAQLEHLCINLCAETMQHFYNTHIFKSSLESCRDEGIVCDAEVDYVDNVPCIDLISSLRTGLLSMLDAECSIRGIAESFVSKIKVQHRNSTRLEYKHTTDPLDTRTFIIKHFAGRIEYDASSFLDTNRDVIADDTVAVFHKHTCNFGFATHLFGSELKALYSIQTAPRGLSFRISPTSHTDLLNGDEPVSTLTQDFHTRLDNLLRTLVHARPHFVRCVRSNSSEKASFFERSLVAKQIRSLQVLETVNLMASGFPHRMRFKQFNSRYRMLAPFRAMHRTEEMATDDCSLILVCALDNLQPTKGSASMVWTSGKRHVFISEGIRQHLEYLRSEIRSNSAKLIQTKWRQYRQGKKMKIMEKSGQISSLLQQYGQSKNSSCQRSSLKKTIADKCTRPRPQPITGTPPPDPNEKFDAKVIQQTCSLFGLDLERAPPVPPSRAYLINGESKLKYPQCRTMKLNFPEESTNSSAEQLKKGQTVCVVGASTCRGHLMVEHKGKTYHVPFHYMDLLTTETINESKLKADGGTNTCINKNKNKNYCYNIIKK